MSKLQASSSALSIFPANTKQNVYYILHPGQGVICTAYAACRPISIQQLTKWHKGTLSPPYAIFLCVTNPVTEYENVDHSAVGTIHFYHR